MAKRNKHRKKNPKWHYGTAGEIPIYVPFLGAVDFLLFFILFLLNRCIFFPLIIYYSG